MSKDQESTAVDSASTEAEAGAQLAILKRATIVRSKTNPRTHFDPAYIQELAASFEEHGVLQPLLVRPLPPSRLQETFEDREAGAPLPTHEIVCGECRWRGAGLAQLEDLPVLIRTLTDIQVLQVQLVENLKRKDLHPMEEAEGFGRLVDEHRMSAEDIAAKVKKSVSYVYKSLKLLELTPECRQELYAGKLTQSTALLVARAPAHLQAAIAKDIMHADFDGEPMSFRQAQRHIQDRYMLQLGSAVFNIADATLIPKAGDCKACPKRTGANADLFEDVKHADTCTDPKCFDAKKVAHFERIAKEAEAKGQKVITGKEAKELMPYTYSEPKGYTLLDRSEYVDGVGSRSVRKLLGPDIPKPTLILNPHTHQLQEALPNDVAGKLLKQAKTKAKAGKSEKNTPRDPQREYELAWPGRAVEHVHRALQDGKVTDFGVDIARLMAKRLAETSLYGDSADRFCKLFDIGNSKVGRTTAIDDWLDTCEPRLLTPAILILMIEDDILNGNVDDKMPALDVIAKACGVDVEAIQDEVKLEIGMTPAPAQSTGKVAKGKRGEVASAVFMAPLTPSPELAAVVGTDPQPRTEIVSKLWAYIKKNGLQDATNKRMINTDETLRALFGKDQVSMFEMAGLVGKHVTTGGKVTPAAKSAPKAKKKTTAAQAKEGIAKALQQQDPAGAGEVKVDTVETPGWPLPVAVDKLVPGTRIKVKEGLRGPNNHFRKICGKEGALDKLLNGVWWAKIDGSKDRHQLKASEFDVLPSAPAAATLKPMPAWPFPPKPGKEAT